MAPIPVDFISFKVVAFSFLEPTIQIVKDDIEFNVSTSFSFSEELGEVKIRQKIDVIQQQKEIDRYVIGSIEVEALFGSFPLEDMKEGDKIILPEIISRILAGLTLSTTRGVLIAKMSGMPALADIIIPVIDPKDLLKPSEEVSEDTEIESNTQ